MTLDGVVLPVSDECYAAVDGGASKVAVSLIRCSDGTVTQTLRRESAAFESFEQALDAIFVELGFIPGRVAFALAGVREGDALSFTYIERWPVFRLRAATDRLGCIGRLDNDAQLQVAGAPLAERTPIRHGVINPRGRIGLINIGTGVGRTDDERDFREYACAQLGTPDPSPEQFLGGLFANLWSDWVVQLNDGPNRFGSGAEARMCELGESGEGIGPVFSEYADADPACRRIIAARGGFYGIYARALMAGLSLNGGLYLWGSGNNALPAYLRHSVFLGRINAHNLPHAGKVETYPVYRAQGDLPALGAWKLLGQM
jgi:glucokinase